MKLVGVLDVALLASNLLETGEGFAHKFVGPQKVMILHGQDEEAIGLVLQF